MPCRRKYTFLVLVKGPSNFEVITHALSYLSREIQVNVAAGGPLTSCVFDVTPHEAHRSTHEIVSTKLFDLNAIKPLDVTFKLQETWEKEEQVKQQLKENTLKFRLWNILQDNWLVY